MVKNSSNTFFMVYIHVCMHMYIIHYTHSTSTCIQPWISRFFPMIFWLICILLPLPHSYHSTPFHCGDIHMWRLLLLGNRVHTCAGTCTQLIGLHNNVFFLYLRKFATYIYIMLVTTIERWSVYGNIMCTVYPCTQHGDTCALAISPLHCTGSSESSQVLGWACDSVSLWFRAHQVHLQHHWQGKQVVYPAVDQKCCQYVHCMCELYPIVFVLCVSCSYSMLD